MWKSIFLVLATLFMVYCGSYTQDYGSKEFCVEKIDSTTFDSTFLFYSTFNAEKAIILSRKSSNHVCQGKIEMGECYSADLHRLRSTSKYIDVGYRLGQNNVYEDGQLVFPANIKYFESTEISGSCIVAPNE